MNTSETGKPRRWVPWVLVAMFFGPLAAAWVLYFVEDDPAPVETVNRGELVRPARPVPAQSFPRAGTDEPVPADFLEGKWSIVLIERAPCDDGCRRRLNDTRQVRLALGRDMSRVERFLVTTGDPEWEALSREHPELGVLEFEPGAHRDWLEPFAVEGARQPLSAPRIYIVDPLGNLMMSYPDGYEPKGLLEDLERLLKYSRVG